MEGYRVERRKYGILVFGPIPIGDMIALVGGWKDDGYDIVATRIAAKLGATLAVCAAGDVTAWEAEIGVR